MNHDTSRIQPQRRQIQIKKENGCDAGKPKKGSGQNCIKKEIEIGSIFSRLTVIADKGRTASGHKMWLVICSCGKVFQTRSYSLLDGKTKSCGCARIEKFIQNNTTHGMALSPEYLTWRAMRDRCSNPNIKCYPSYGGRGIRVCHQWMESFDCFLKDMGLRPSKDHSLDRIDNDGDYSPSNCRWTTRKEQQRNRRCTRKLTAFGQTKAWTEWCEIMKIPYDLIRYRFNSGWNPEDILTTKSDPKYKPKTKTHAQ